MVADTVFVVVTGMDGKVQFVVTVFLTAIIFIAVAQIGRLGDR